MNQVGAKRKECTRSDITIESQLNRMHIALLCVETIVEDLFSIILNFQRWALQAPPELL